jgi:hypothetical protein
MSYKDPEQRRAYNKTYKKRYYAENRERLLAESLQWQRDNPERSRAKVKRWKENNPEKARKSQKKSDKKYQQANLKKIAAYQKKYRDLNAETVRPQAAARNRKWRRVNPEKAKVRDSIQNAERRAALANPPWANRGPIRQAIKAFYAACPPGHEVDHIIPLQGKNICGLHIPWNLQYLPISENRSKGAKH